ncbi:lysozyme [Apodospora peruviana]|uniref:Lysozyme n=1 Tax=Apodospora peruviana TaxID=516989 RepID=A0AAE0M1W7_9PEZI|nr:lysozyme [Apodospora peruviana]
MHAGVIYRIVYRQFASAICIGPPFKTTTLNLIREFEGWYPNIYGHPTVGYGHLCTDKTCSDVPYRIPLSTADGEKLLRSDLTIAQNCITRQTADPVTLKANQYAALVSWAFNVGCGASGSSTLIQRLNAGEEPNRVAQEELPRWKYGDNGVVLPGLVRRRAAEVDLHKTPSNVPALPVVCS